jgi:hypothetical protein
MWFQSFPCSWTLFCRSIYFDSYSSL